MDANDVDYAIATHEIRNNEIMFDVMLGMSVIAEVFI
jgi:hypothetical protein